MTDSSVKVGIRVRPLLPKEANQEEVIAVADSDSLTFKSQSMTYDHVFGSELSQEELYRQTAYPMLRSFLDGYNVTIMAYGQTGSGKSYTMGTTGNIDQDIDQQGLVPRFVTDLFENLKAEPHEQEKTRVSYKVRVSFIEVYIEDIYDLLSDQSSSYDKTLQVREDDLRGVYVFGQTETEVNSSDATMDLLHFGLNNRRVGETNMNATSSRSHAIFTVMLEQTLLSDDDVQQIVTSKLSFVDLAGSERCKRTGAEGQRKKEGIEINRGLSALGMVILALTKDDKKSKHSAKKANNHVPYRNCKLTHLLKDALGGNSQTLFLACVSPADSNSVETENTLRYARNARNIQNKPVINMDKHQLQLRRARMAEKAWKTKALAVMYGQALGISISGSNNVMHSPIANGVLRTPKSSNKSNAVSAVGLDIELEDLMKLPEVIEYVELMERAISEKVKDNSVIPSPMHKRLSLGNALSPVRMPQYKTPGVGGKSRVSLGLPRIQERSSYDSHISEGEGDAAHFKFNSDSTEMLLLDSQDSEEAERMVEKLVNIAQKEKEMIDGVEDKDLEEMDKVIKEKEEILTTLLDTVKNYAVMKTEFEKLLDTINGLEQQRKEMEIELEMAKHATTSLNPAAKLGLEKLKEKFERVNKELNSLKTERKSKESAYRLIQRDAKQCETLKKDLQKLKESKVVLIRQQKAQSQQILKMRKEQAQKVSSMKRSDVKKQQQMNSLKGKLAVKERVLDKKDAEIRRLTIKLSACNKHITQLLKIQHKSHARITNGKAGLSSTSDSSVFGSLSLPDQELLVSSKALLDSTVQERVERTQARVLYTKKSHYLQGLNKELALEAAELESLLERKKAMVADLRDKYGGMGSDLSNEGWEEEAVMTNSHLVVVMEDDRAELYSLLLSIDAVESNIERITKEQDHYNADLDSLSLKLEEQVDSVSTDRKCDHDQLPVGESSWDAVAREVVATLNLAQSHTLLWELLDEKTEALENLRISDDDLVKARADNIYYAERVVELSNQVTALRSEMRQRLDKVEKQRVMDIWALLQAQHKDSDDNSNTAVEDTASKIAVQRAQDLERELDGFLVNEEKLKLSNVEQEKTIEMLNQEIAELHLRIQDLDISAIDLQRYQSKDQIGNTNAKRVSLFEMKESQYLDKLLPIWNSLGVEKADREEIVQYVNKAKAMAKDRVIVDAEQQLSSTRREVEVAEAELNLLCTALGLAPDQQIGNFNQMKTDLPLLQWLQQLKLAISDCGQQIESKFPNLLTLRERLANLKSEMMLRDDELSLNLSHLLSIDLVSLAQDSFDISNKPNDRDSVDSHISVTSLYHESLSHKIAIQLQLHQCSLKQVSAWENEIRKLNLDRVHYTQKGISLRDETVKLAKELSLSDKHSYSQILHQEESEVMTAVVQLILTNSSSNPPGSAKLVNALEQLKMTLECVKVNRINAAALMNKYVLLITEHFGLSVDSLGVEIMDQLESYQRQYLEMLHSRCEAIYPLLRSLRHKMGDQLFESIRATSNISENDTHGYASITMQINELIKAKASKISLITMQKTPAKDCLRRSSNSGLIPEEEESNSLLSYSSLLIKVVNFESNVQEVIADIADLKMLLDEEWLQKYMESVAQFWDLSCKSDATPANPMLNSSPNTTLRNAVRENSILQAEINRLDTIGLALGELRKNDKALAQHVADMEEFEETSKQNRIKALSGNSKLLVEEEKFRKQGKKKYEQITAQMLQLFQRLTHMTNLNSHDNSNAVQAFYSIGIDVKVDISWMSAMGKDLLRGGMFKDKIGLMHLNASAAPTINAAGAGRANSAKGMSNMLQASRIASVKSAATPLSPKPKNHTNTSPLRGGRSHSPPRSVFRFDENKDHSNIPSAHGQNAAKRSATRSTENNA